MSHLYAGMPFDEFVDWLLTEEGADQKADRHWLSQTEMIPESCDFVEKIENLSQALKVLEKELGLSFSEFPESNSSCKENRVDISKKTLGKIGERYREDFRRFDYPFPV